MESGPGPVSSRGHLQARPPPPETLPRASWDEDAYDCPDYYYLRDLPASGAGRSKGRTRREQVLRTNRTVPGGHERKIAQKLLAGLRKRRQRQLQPRPRTRLA
ncbi:PREDICTED: nuclear transcriptional regulator 1-like protein [Chinchilla lanigera]|uniref:Nuclear protein 2, transcriptional regulator n=1 Tax=Chinchilla lanigera TaxID=34839 RepID=A0A8C2YLV4_CHILA|nr:PREDICTED: nuclear transcriptional regulator 1-like protein [Chinchilla lanigera]